MNKIQLVISNLERNERIFKKFAQASEPASNPTVQAILEALEQYQKKFESIIKDESFKYLGEENISSLRTSLGVLIQTLKNIIEPSDDPAVKQITDQLLNSFKEIAYPKLEKSRDNKDISSTKVIQDRFALFSPFEKLYKLFQTATKNDSSFGVVQQRFKEFIIVITQVIQNTSEEMTEVDMTEHV